ncbi:GHKL domain-containing protein [Candidatus Uhrbacteria bacterium]|nr:GHKL domain-containing protein [Candidatus Uhrbacteria bacterium]
MKKKLSKKNTEMTSMIAHELRSPIGSIRAAASLLAEGAYGKLPRQAKETALLIQNSADRLLSQAEGYLQVMRLASNAYEVQVEPYDIKDLLKKMFDEWIPQFKLKQIKLKSELKNLPDTVEIDQSVLAHIVYNLLDNAVKYTESGSVSIKVEWKDSQLIITVSDTGEGMSRATIAELFRHPMKRKKKVKTDGRGMGLGLYIVGKLLKAAKGSITAKSKGKSKGSTFIVHLPARKVDATRTGK